MHFPKFHELFLHHKCLYVEVRGEMVFAVVDIKTGAVRKILALVQYPIQQGISSARGIERSLSNIQPFHFRFQLPFNKAPASSRLLPF